MFKKKPLPELSHLSGQDDFVDIPLRITGKVNLEGHYKIWAEALFHGEPVSLTIELAKNISGAPITGDRTHLFLKDTIRFKGGAKANNRLLQAISHIYGFPDDSLKLKQKKDFTVLNMNRKKVKYRRGIALFKLFLKSKSLEAELFLNFDFKEKIVYLKEKDPGHRENILEILKVGGK